MHTSSLFHIFTALSCLTSAAVASTSSLRRQEQASSSGNSSLSNTSVSTNSSSTTPVTFTLPNVTPSKAVFAHYMVGGLTKEHARIDVERAMNLGLDAFSLNVGDPTLGWVKDSLDYLFTAAEEVGFKLFVSMDLSASGGSCWLYCTSCGGLDDFTWIVEKYSATEAYYKVQGYPMITTFSSGGFEFKHFHAWQANLTTTPYFIPDIDETWGYYEASSGWWDYWGEAINGVMSWESTWPAATQTGNGNIDLDNTVIAGTANHSKSYMIGLSTMQYKNAYGTNLFRRGGNIFSRRMEDILNMEIQPDFVQYLTWNDMPESHYIAEIWPESNGDYLPSLYAAMGTYSHVGWQGLLASFITAFKSNATTMAPLPHEPATGALWYKTILQSTNCTMPPTLPVLPKQTYCRPMEDSSSDASQYFKKPYGWEAGDDDIHWAVTAPLTSSNWTVNLISGGKIISTKTLAPGLNAGSDGPVNLGAQQMEVLDGEGTVVMSASGEKNVTNVCENHIYNMNYQVAGLVVV